MDDKKQKAKSYFILMLLTLIVVVAAFVVMYISANIDMILMCVAVGVIAFIISAIAGGAAHRNVDKDGAKWERVVHVLTVPAYVASYLLFIIGASLFKLVKDGWNNADTSTSDKSDNNNIIIKTKGGREIELHFIGYSTYYNYYNPVTHKSEWEHPYFGKSYLSYFEVTSSGSGPNWMSFDEGKTFVCEDDFNPYTYKI